MARGARKRDVSKAGPCRTAIRPVPVDQGASSSGQWGQHLRARSPFIEPRSFRIPKCCRRAANRPGSLEYFELEIGLDGNFRSFAASRSNELDLGSYRTG
jgi:hypothetical protein